MKDLEAMLKVKDNILPTTIVGPWYLYEDWLALPARNYFQQWLRTGQERITVEAICDAIKARKAPIGLAQLSCGLPFLMPQEHSKNAYPVTVDGRGVSIEKLVDRYEINPYTEKVERSSIPAPVEVVCCRNHELILLGTLQEVQRALHENPGWSPLQRGYTFEKRGGMLNETFSLVRFMQTREWCETKGEVTLPIDAEKTVKISYAVTLYANEPSRIDKIALQINHDWRTVTVSGKEYEVCPVYTVEVQKVGEGYVAKGCFSLYSRHYVLDPSVYLDIQSNGTFSETARGGAVDKSAQGLGALYALLGNPQVKVDFAETIRMAILAAEQRNPQLLLDNDFLVRKPIPEQRTG